MSAVKQALEALQDLAEAEEEQQKLREWAARLERERDEARRALAELMEQPTMNPLSITPEQRQRLWAAHKQARRALAQQGDGR